MISARKLVIVGWEGADWAHARPLLDAGHMPALASLIRTGCSGPIRGFAPWLPPVLWTTLATGAHPDRHGIHGVAVFDETSGRPGATGTRQRRISALWNDFSAQGRSCAVLGWPGTYPAEALPRGLMAGDVFAHAPLGPGDPWPVPAGAVSPVARAADLAGLRLRPQEIDTGLLGLFMPNPGGIDRALDSRPGLLVSQLSELYTMHNTAVVVCGEAQPDFLAVHFPFIAAVQREFGIFQAPRHPAASSGDCDRYDGMVSSAYRLQDALLADLINTCETDTAIIVVSAHGLAHGAARPVRRPRTAAEYAAWCRPHGLLAMKGPGLLAGETVSGARIEDLAPTVLAWAGLARHAGRDGRVLGEIFSQPPATPASAPAHAGYPCAPGDWTPFIASPDSQTAPAAGRLLQRLIDQGLVNPLAGSLIEPGRSLSAENAFLLGTALSALHRPADALAPLHQAFLAAPESPRRALSLLHCLLRLGLADEIAPVLPLFLDYGPHDSRHRLASAALKLHRRRPEECLALLAEVTELEFAENRRTLERMAFSRLRRPADEAASFQSSLATQPETAELWLGLALARLRTGRFDEARVAALRARTLDNDLPAVAAVLQHAETALRTGCLPTAFAHPSAPTWSQLTEKALARKTLRDGLRERAARYPEERAHARSTLHPAESMNKTCEPFPSGETGGSVASPAGDSPSWSVRPPWPDEISRIQTQFSPALRNTRVGNHHLWVLVIEATERLVGVIVLSEIKNRPAKTTGADGPHGRVDLDLRDAWADTPAGDALLSVVVRHARALGLALLDLQTRVSEKLDALLRRHDFTEVIRHEIWTAALPDALACQQAEYDRILKRWPVPLEPFQAGHLEIARKICEDTGLLPSEKIVMRSLRHPQGIEPAASFVAGSPGRPVAILLSSIDGTRAEIEIVARNPETPAAAPVAVPALLTRFLLAARDLGCLEVRCSLRPGLTPNLVSLMKKWNGCCRQRQAVYRHRLG